MATYIWDDIDIPIVQPYLEQNIDSCSFAATARQIEYDIRLRYAKSDPPTPLRAGPLVLHEEWQKQLEQKYPNHKRWKPIELLEEALGMDHNNPNRKERGGVPLWNGTVHCINAMEIVPVHKLNVADMKVLFSYNIPVIGVILLRQSYPDYAERPYIGFDLDGKLDKVMYNRNGTLCTHAVVLVGQYEAKGGDLHGLKPGTYWIYQNSPTKNTPVGQSLLPDEMNIIHPSMVIEAYYSVSFAPSVLAPQSDAVRIAGQQQRMKQRREAEWQLYDQQKLEIEELKQHQQHRRRILR